MLTIRAIGVRGDEEVFQAATVRQGVKFKEQSGNWRSMLDFLDEKFMQVHPSICGGMVYVMNDSGKTVAHYDCGGWVGPDADPPTDSVPAVVEQAVS